MKHDFSMEFTKNRLNRSKMPYRRKVKNKSSEEHLPLREGLKAVRLRGWNYNYMKSFHYNSVKSYLERNVGRLWNDVWQDVCQHTDRKGKRYYKLREYILSLVERNSTERFRFFYVDSNGFLRKHYKERRKLHNRPEPKTLIQLENGDVLQKRQGIWYYGQKTIIPKNPDLLSEKTRLYLLSRNKLEQWIANGDEKISYRTLPSPILRFYGLENDP